MSMTDKDKVKFESLWKKLQNLEPSPRSEDISTRTDLIPYLAYKVARLEKLVYFCILALSGEGYATPELKEAMRRLGLYDLFEEGLR